ncbi:unnamed protein product [Prunus armeniaca]|uniref:Uncharacterized protein n=1 Tax=Prunus armeniaca TaxID=36596 RepID=A0A6J5WKX4_PRUAR|nr:unnamed protein product [Prunus armeniaca]CAB4300272.1 unnamed protein product [Prunus armeniaca]
MEDMSTLETHDSHTALLAFREGVTLGTKMHKSLVKTPYLDIREVLMESFDLKRKKLVQCKGKWFEELPNVLWCTEPQAYEIEVVIPIEIELPIIRTVVVDGKDNDQQIACNLYLIKEHQEVATL